MNRLILSPEEIPPNHTIFLHDRRAEHIRTVLKTPIGGKIRFGIINGDLGVATLQDDDGCKLKLHLLPSKEKPAKTMPCTLVLALPRPKVAKRIIQSICTLGFEQIHLINSAKTDKSYWQSHYLEKKTLREQLILGLEQSGSTFLPKLYTHKLFRPFAEDVLPGLCKNKTALIAHPYAEQPCPYALKTPSLLIIGPDGGFTEFEVSLLEKSGANPVNIGSRILRVETVIPTLAGRLYL